MTAEAASGSELIVTATLDLDADSTYAGLDTERWRRLAEASLRAEGVHLGELNLIFVDADAMAALNMEHMDGTGPTDVLAFPIDGEDPSLLVASEAPILLGDVVICPAVAASNAAERNISTDDELALLVVHGLLHIIGHDHAEDDERAAMQLRERALLDAHHP